MGIELKNKFNTKEFTLKSKDRKHNINGLILFCENE